MEISDHNGDLRRENVMSPLTWDTHTPVAGLDVDPTGTEPTPMKTRKAVPMSSAASFCLIDGSSIAIHTPCCAMGIREG